MRHHSGDSQHKNFKRNTSIILVCLFLAFFFTSFWEIRSYNIFLQHYFFLHSSAILQSQKFCINNHRPFLLFIKIVFFVPVIFFFFSFLLSFFLFAFFYFALRIQTSFNEVIIIFIYSKCNKGEKELRNKFIGKRKKKILYIILRILFKCDVNFPIKLPSLCVFCNMQSIFKTLQYSWSRR